MTVILDWLQGWFEAQSNGDWEHCFGIKIISSNFGWSIVIDLEETECEGKPFAPREITGGEGDWYYCLVKNKQFEAACGSLNLSKVLQIFREWVQECKGIESNLQN
jgi:hypothetical protein